MRHKRLKLSAVLLLGLGLTGLQAQQSINAVGGTIVAEGIYCKLQQNWPDFVFEKDYDLPSLSAVEDFINENKHLPNVPSATDIRISEISLGDMNATLLRKIEELTLYIIEQDKRIEKLENKKE